MTTFLDITGDVLIVLGALIFATAALGILRFPDAYTRISAIGTAGGIGIIFIVIGALLHQPTLPDLLKVALIIALQLATSAIGTMAIARSTVLTRTRMHRPRYNDLDTDLGHEQDPPPPVADELNDSDEQQT